MRLLVLPRGQDSRDGGDDGYGRRHGGKLVRLVGVELGVVADDHGRRQRHGQRHRELQRRGQQLVGRPVGDAEVELIDL